MKNGPSDFLNSKRTSSKLKILNVVYLRHDRKDLTESDFIVSPSKNNEKLIIYVCVGK